MKDNQTTESYKCRDTSVSTICRQVFVDKMFDNIPYNKLQPLPVWVADK